MLNFVFRRIRNKKWMVISLLLGNLLMVAITVSTPMYSQAILQRTLIRCLNESYTETNRHPGIIEVNGLNAQAGKSTEENYAYITGMMELLSASVEKIQLPVLSSTAQLYKAGAAAVHETKMEDGENEVKLQMSACSGVADHIQIVYGAYI